jgi:hypothetical protein
VLIDADGAGHGWSFERSGPADGRVDLLSVVVHELGHVLGFDHVVPSGSGVDFMGAVLSTGIRLTPIDSDRFIDRVATPYQPDTSELVAHSAPRTIALDLPPMSAVALPETSSGNSKHILVTGTVAGIVRTQDPTPASDQANEGWLVAGKQDTGKRLPQDDVRVGRTPPGRRNPMRRLQALRLERR